MRKINGFQRFFQLEAASGIVLFACTLLALAWANSPIRESYQLFWHRSVSGMSLHHWLNDGLMTIFFLVVGLEIKREILQGELSTKQKASLPIAAALGGMIVPALIYSMFNWGTPGVGGWGIPMATDIAFTIGVVTLLGNRVPSSLRVFLTAFAIVDDIGAVLVIAMFYTATLSWLNLGIGIGIFTVLFIFNRIGIVKAWGYLMLGVFAWFAFLQSGIHATVAGILLAFVIPMQTGITLEERFHPWVSFLIMPLFAFANAGVVLSDGNFFHSVSLGVIFGLILGKQLGITLFSWIAIQWKFAVLPERVTWRQLYGVAWLGGIGFTMSLFISNLAFGSDNFMVDVAKIGVFVSSIISGLIGAAILLKRSR